MFTSLLVTLYSTLKFHKPSRGFYGKFTRYDTTTDYMEYSSKITENRICKNLIEKQTEQACDWTERKRIRFEKTTIKAVLKKNQYIWTQINVNDVLPALDVAFWPFL